MDKNLVGTEESVSCIRCSQFWNPFRGGRTVCKLFEDDSWIFQPVISTCERLYYKKIK